MQVYLTMSFEIPAEKSLAELDARARQFVVDAGGDILTCEVIADIPIVENKVLRVRYNPEAEVSSKLPED